MQHLKRLLPANLRRGARRLLESTLLGSLRAAAEEQGLTGMVERLSRIIPDITGQYSTFNLDSAYLLRKVRNLHAFQLSLVDKAIAEFKQATIIDIGDSSGNHLQYILKLYGRDKVTRCVSVNLDRKAIEKIKMKGMEAIHARAEDLSGYDVNADIILCFELLEHLMNPCEFLRNLAMKTNARSLIITVPYLKASRLGLSYVRFGRTDNVCAENTHIFELSPQDWRLLFRHCGWNPVLEQTYLQYPRFGIFRVTAPYWKRTDYAGFYGVILKKDGRWSGLYADW